MDLFNKIDKWKRQNRSRNSSLNSILIFFLVLLVVCLFLNQHSHQKIVDSNRLNHNYDIDEFIDQIREIIIIDQKLSFNINYSFTLDGIPTWLYRYGITYLFNFYWLQNGAYQWHLQRLFDLKHSVTNMTQKFQQRIPKDFHRIYTFDYLNHHPEYGIVLDTALDPIKPLFSLLPQANMPFKKICQFSPQLHNLFPCQTRTKPIVSSSIQPLITYALYDTTIDLSKNSTTTKIVTHYDELIFLFDLIDQPIDQMIFIRQILPRLIRLLALVPESSKVLLPNVNSNTYISQYLDVFIERGLINDRKRFIPYNSSEIYHANVIYSTSSPRDDLILLHRILIGSQPISKPELILIIRQNLDDDNYGKIVQTIDLMEFPDELRIHEYNATQFDVKYFGVLLQQARLVIGMSTELFSHLVWCQSRIDIIEILQKTMTTDAYEISLQLQLNYWLVRTTQTNQIDMIDFRNLMMKIFMNINT